MMNKMLYSVFVFQLCLITLYAGLSVGWQSKNGKNTYLMIEGEPGVGTFFL